MIIWKLIKSLQFSQLKSLSILFVKSPVLFVLSVFATYQCMLISTELFGNTHHKHNKSNAFRHALWNVLIIEKCLKWNRKVEKSAAWAKRITDWHEDFSPNDPLARTMDLHNNEVGRMVFQKLYKKGETSKTQLISELQKEIEKSEKLVSVEDISKHKWHLVYIEG